MGGVDYLTRPAPGVLVAHHAALPAVRVRRETFADFPFAEFKPVTEHEAKGFCGRTPRVTGELFQPALLSRA